MTVRQAVAEDVGAIASVLRAAFADFRPLYTEGGFAATTPGADELRARWSEGPVWVAASEGVVVGTVAAVLRTDSLYVRSMAVLPEARGRGVGRLLLAEVEAYASGRACRRMFLSTTPFLAQAIRLYQQRGFRRTGEGPDQLFGTPLFTMEKLLEARE